MRILGISPAHDSSVCVLNDGEVELFLKEERLSKVKRAAIPTMALNAALSLYDHFDAVVYASPSDSTTSKFQETLNYIKTKVSVGDCVDLSDEHHLQHASLAFFNSGFTEAAVIVVDRNGSIKFESSRESESIFYAQYPCEFSTVYKSLWVYNNHAQVQESDVKDKCDFELEARSMHGVVKVYETATSLIQQNILENGKTMGLSAYGNKEKQFVELFMPNSSIPVDYHFGHASRNGSYEAVNRDLQKQSTSDINKDNYQIYADYAWQVQKQTQLAVCKLIEKAIFSTSTKNVVITGGYGLNVVANGFYREHFPEINFFFEPLADDTGNSIGAAMLYYRQKTQDSSLRPLENTFFQGVGLPELKDVGVSCSASDVVEALMHQKCIAIFNGMAEAGPRALGNRSILFDPRTSNAVDIVNKIKKREWYRPFAAACLKEDAHKFFENVDEKNAKFMTVNFLAKQEAKECISGVLHIDGTCRIQIVEEGTPLFDLLTIFKQKTGIGVLLNTSFNLAGDPLVETQQDAINVLNNSDLNYVWFPEIQKIVGKEGIK